MLGQLPAPYVYGAIYGMDETSSLAFHLTMFYSWLGILFVAIAAIFRTKQFNLEEKQKEAEKENEKENDLEKIKKDDIKAVV